jgi:hypothetical protein
MKREEKIRLQTIGSSKLEARRPETKAGIQRMETSSYNKENSTVRYNKQMGLATQTVFCIGRVSNYGLLIRNH